MAGQVKVLWLPLWLLLSSFNSVGNKSNKAFHVIERYREPFENVFPPQEIESDFKIRRESDPGFKGDIPDGHGQDIEEKLDESPISNDDGGRFAFAVINPNGLGFLEGKNREGSSGIDEGVNDDAFDFNGNNGVSGVVDDFIGESYRTINAHEGSSDAWGTLRNNGLPPYFFLAFLQISPGEPSASVYTTPNSSTMTTNRPAYRLMTSSIFSLSQVLASIFSLGIILTASSAKKYKAWKKRSQDTRYEMLIKIQKCTVLNKFKLEKCIGKRPYF